MQLIILLFVIIYPLYIIVRSIKHRAFSEAININSNSKIEIGMNFEDVNNIIDRKNIFEESEMGNGYKWIRAWISPFDIRIRAAFCFNSDKLESIEIYPYSTEISKPKTWEDACEENMENEYKFCKKWYSKHKKYFPRSAEVFKDYKNWSAGIIIR